MEADLVFWAHDSRPIYRSLTYIAVPLLGPHQPRYIGLTLYMARKTTLVSDLNMLLWILMHAGRLLTRPVSSFVWHVNYFHAQMETKFLSFLVALNAFIINSNAASGDKVGIMRTLVFHWVVCKMFYVVVAPVVAGLNMGYWEPHMSCMCYKTIIVTKTSH